MLSPLPHVCFAILINPILPFFLLTNVLIIRFSSFFLFWLMLEINRLAFIYYSYASGNRALAKLEYFQHGLFYFMIQSFFSVLLLLSLFSSSDNSFSYINFFLVLFVLLFKLSLFPMENWIIFISKYLRMSRVFLLLSFQKLPLITFITNIFREISFLLICFSSLFRCFSIIFCRNLLDLLLYSSIYGNFWLIIFYIYDVFYFLFFFFLFYCPILWLICKLCYSSVSRITDFLVVLASLSFLGSIPPLLFFLLKFNLFSFMICKTSVLLLFFSWLVGFISLLGYFKFFCIFFFYQYNLMETKVFQNVYPFLLLFLRLFIYF